MKLKNVFLFIVISIFISSKVQAQKHYQILYDYKTENVTYLLLDKNSKVIDTLDDAKLKRNSIVELKLQNVNPFAVKVKTDVKEEDLISSGQGFNFSSLLGGINSFTGDNLNLNASSLPDSDMFTSNSASRGSASASSSFEDLNNTLTNVDALKTTLVSNLLNPNLSKDEILNNLTTTADAEQDVRLPSAKDNFYVYLAKVKKSITDSKSQLEANIDLMSKDIENTALTNQSASRGELVSRNIALNNLQRLIQNLNTSTTQSVQSLEELKSMYTLLEASNFEQTYDYEIQADKVDIELKFIQSDFSTQQENDDEANTLKTRHIKLYAKGGFKINTSVALTLNNFGDKSQDFFIDGNGVIGSDNNDFFVPNLSTMINFYPYISDSFNFGGSFGLSIPISGEDRISGVNFLFGPSLFFGNKSRLSLSGGLAYGPVRKLTNGVSVGDTTAFNDLDAFTKNVYDFGYYFGISFSLFDIK